MRLKLQRKQLSLEVSLTPYWAPVITTATPAQVRSSGRATGRGRGRGHAAGRAYAAGRDCGTSLGLVGTTLNNRTC